MDTDVRQARQAALGRMQARVNICESYSESERLRARLDERTLPKVDLYAPKFRPPATLAEWIDDRVLERAPLTGCPETGPLVTLLEAMRQGRAEAVKAVRAARALDRGAQAVAYRNIVAWRQQADAAKLGAETLINAVDAEWSRQHLAERDDD